MTPILVFATVVAFVAVEIFLSHRRRVVARAIRALPALSSASNREAARNLFLHPGHSWVRLHGRKLVSIGATAFASNFAGRLEDIVLPREGERLRQGDPAWTLLAARHRSLSQPMPLDGKVLAVNTKVLDEPGLTQRAPYGEGWILRVRPRNLPRGLGNLIRGSYAVTWLDALRAAISTRLSPLVGAVADDGGEWAPGFGDQLDDRQWETLRRELFPGQATDGDAA